MAERSVAISVSLYGDDIGIKAEIGRVASSHHLTMNSVMTSLVRYHRSDYGILVPGAIEVEQRNMGRKAEGLAFAHDSKFIVEQERQAQSIARLETMFKEFMRQFGMEE